MRSWHRIHAKLQRNDLQLPVSAWGSPLGARHWARVVGAGQWVAAGGAAMSNTGKFADRTPGIRQAGLTSALANESSSACLDYPEPPSTPEGIKKWRKSLQQEPGKVLIHPGQMADKQPDGRTYGRLNYKDASTTDLMNWEPTSEMLAMMRDKQESIYASTKAEPLGRGMDRGHVLPERMKEPGFMFGKAGDRGNGTSKEALFPVPTENDEEGKAHELYLTSHGDYNPGEQKTRAYDWDSTGIDPSTHRFGVSEKMAMGGGSEEVMKAMDPTLTLGEGTAIVSSVVEDYKNYANAELGKVKNLGLANPAGVEQGHAYGLKSGEKDDWGTAECIKGAYEGAAQQPDKDLGTTLRPGWRNTVNPGDEERKFGVPGCRTDIAPPRARSVADHQNYGDEPGAFTVMYPSKYAVNGVDEMDFNMAFSKAKVKVIISAAFPEVTDEEFEEVYATASPSGEDISVETWRSTWNQKS